MTHLLHPLLTRYALAKPNMRSSHQRSTPQGGGLAVIAATIGFASLLASRSAALRPASGPISWAFSPQHCWLHSSVLPTISARSRSARASCCKQSRSPLVIFTLPAELSIIPLMPAWAERAMLFAGMLWFVNLVNFMDGIDWMTVAEVVPVAAGLALVGLLGALPAYAVVVALALLGAMLGFAPFNRPVARIFLGDVGSLPIGLLLGWLLVLLAGRGHVAAALLLPLYYLADATITLLRRFVNGEKIWQAHRTHFYQRATDNGFAVLDIVRRVFALNLGLVALALATVWFDSCWVSVVALVLGDSCRRLPLGHFRAHTVVNPSGALRFSPSDQERRVQGLITLWATRWISR